MSLSKSVTSTYQSNGFCVVHVHPGKSVSEMTGCRSGQIGMLSVSPDIRHTKLGDRIGQGTLGVDVDQSHRAAQEYRFTKTT